MFLNFQYLTYQYPVLSYNHDHNIFRLFDVLTSFLLPTSETKHGYY